MRPDPTENTKARCVSKIEGAADILGMGEAALSQVLELAWTEGGLTDSEYATAREERVAGAAGLHQVPVEDNWKHRSQHMRCNTCMWYAPKESLEPSFHIGRCRRRAPSMNGWPVMIGSDWCGDHKLDENKATPTGEI
jgi:hypothetical protein